MSAGGSAGRRAGAGAALSRELDLRVVDGYGSEEGRHGACAGCEWGGEHSGASGGGRRRRWLGAQGRPGRLPGPPGGRACAGWRPYWRGQSAFWRERWRARRRRGGAPGAGAGCRRPGRAPGRLFGPLEARLHPGNAHLEGRRVGLGQRAVGGLWRPCGGQEAGRRRVAEWSRRGDQSLKWALAAVLARRAQRWCDGVKQQSCRTSQFHALWLIRVV